MWRLYELVPTWQYTGKYKKTDDSKIIRRNFWRSPNILRQAWDKICWTIGRLRHRLRSTSPASTLWHVNARQSANGITDIVDELMRTSTRATVRCWETQSLIEFPTTSDTDSQSQTQNESLQDGSRVPTETDLRSGSRLNQIQQIQLHTTQLTSACKLTKFKRKHQGETAI